MRLRQDIDCCIRAGNQRFLLYKMLGLCSQPRQPRNVLFEPMKHHPYQSLTHCKQRKYGGITITRIGKQQRPTWIEEKVFKREIGNIE